MAQSLAEREAGALLNELFAVAEKSEQLSSRFPLLGNLFEIPNWPSLRLSLSYYHSPLHRSHPSPFLKHTLRQRTQHRYSHNLLRFLFVHDRGHRRRRRRRHSGRWRRHLLVATRLRQVIDGGEAAERRLESLGGRRHTDRCRSARFKVRKIIPRSPQNARFIVLIRWRPFEPRMEKENGAQLFPRFRHVAFHLPLRFLSVPLRHGISNCPVNLHTAFDTSY